MYATRLKAVILVLAVGSVVLLGVLLDLQVIHGERYRREADRQMKGQLGLLPTLRGTVYDRKGRELAHDTARNDLWVYYPFIPPLEDEFVARMAREWKISKAELRLRVEEMWQRLAHETRVPIEEIQRRRQTIRDRVDAIRRAVAEHNNRRIRIREETYGEAGSIPHPLIYDVEPRLAHRVELHPKLFPGIERHRPAELGAFASASRKRAYPYGDVAPHVVGQLGEVNAPELDDDRINADHPPGDLKRYLPGDLVGRAGVERATEDVLRGTRGLYQKGLDEGFVENIPPRPGEDVQLTLDIALQADVEDRLDAALDDRRVVGAAVVLDVTTGEVLALASAPRYDVRSYTTDYPDLVSNPDHPLTHRAVAGQYPLGSVFKAVVATAALHEGVITPDTFLRCDGVLDPSNTNRFKCHIFPHGHGDIRLRKAIKKSCNVFFYKLALEMSRDRRGRLDYARGIARLAMWARRLGLGRATGIRLPGEATGSLEGIRHPANFAIGQGRLKVTPIQAAQLYGLIATGGRMPKLTLVKKPHQSKPPRLALDLNPRHMRAIRDAFDAVVNEQGGTGHSRVYDPITAIAGKTGTAQAGAGEPHAWFVGYAPAADPKIAVAVIIEHGGHGGATAGPVTKGIIEACRAHGYLPRPENAGEAAAMRTLRR